MEVIITRKPKCPLVEYVSLSSFDCIISATYVALFKTKVITAQRQRV